jgi:hypothetical protein
MIDEHPNIRLDRSRRSGGRPIQSSIGISLARGDLQSHFRAGPVLTDTGPPGWLLRSQAGVYSRGSCLPNWHEKARESISLSRGDLPWLAVQHGEVDVGHGGLPASYLVGSSPPIPRERLADPPKAEKDLIVGGQILRPDRRPSELRMTNRLGLGPPIAARSHTERSEVSDLICQIIRLDCKTSGLRMTIGHGIGPPRAGSFGFSIVGCSWSSPPLPVARSALNRAVVKEFFIKGNSKWKDSFCGDFRGHPPWCKRHGISPPIRFVCPRESIPTTWVDLVLWYSPSCRRGKMVELQGVGLPNSTECFPQHSGGLPPPACGSQSLPIKLGGSCAPDFIGPQEPSSFATGYGMTKGQGNGPRTRFVRARETIAIEPFRRFQAISKRPFGRFGGYSCTKGGSSATSFRRGSQVHNFHREGFV